MENSLDGIHWHVELSEQTCNHGGCPLDRREVGFQHRGTCAPGVVTDGWFGFDGECSGAWGPYGADHLCNDDTALQINNAFGRWTGDRCISTHRRHTPGCQMHW